MHQGVVYRCDADDGTRFYTSSPKAGMECSAIQYSFKPGRWRYITSSEDGADISIDTKTIDRSKKPYITLWVKFLRKPESKNTESTLSRFSINCNARESALLEKIEQKGNTAEPVLWKSTKPQYVSIPPDTVIEAIFDTVCVEPG